jgi:hypothetical protein
MAKYLLLKHYRGAPAPVNDVPMEQWTPEELSAHPSSPPPRTSLAPERREARPLTVRRGAGLTS